MYEVKEICYGKYYVVDDYGRFVCSAYTHEEAKADIEELKNSSAIHKKVYLATYLRAKAIWITENGKHLQIPIEEPTVFKSFVTASSPQDAVVKVHRDNKDYVITNIQLS